MKRTILYDRHISLGAKMTEFGGYEMPVQYAGVIAEHTAARTGASVFDTCHMGEFIISGSGAAADLERILSCDVGNLKIGRCRYGFICNEDGGVIDDQILYRMAQDEFMMVVNATREADDYHWILEHIAGDTAVSIVTSITGKIDLQGPGSPKIAAALMDRPIDELKYYGFMRNSYRGEEIIISRTGYTGEIGFEIYGCNAVIKDLWDSCVTRGAAPAGLGARDILRLEMGFPLYGNELSANRNAAQSGFTGAISVKKDFIGAAKIRGAASATAQSLRGIDVEGRRTAHKGDIVLAADGTEIGVVTSGAFAPSLGHSAALSYIDQERAVIGTEVKIISGKNELAGKITTTPFYKNGTARAGILS